MASLNRTDRLTLDAFSDPNLAGPVYNKFTNTLKNPLLGVKGVQLVNLDTINCSLQLNDDNGQQGTEEPDWNCADGVCPVCRAVLYDVFCGGAVSQHSQRNLRNHGRTDLLRDRCAL